MRHKYEENNAFPQTIAKTIAVKNLHLSYF